MIALIRSLYVRWINRRDPALVIQTPVIKFAKYDKAQQAKAFKDRQAECRRQFAAVKPKPIKRSTVVAFRKEQAK